MSILTANVSNTQISNMVSKKLDLMIQHRTDTDRHFLSE